MRDRSKQSSSHDRSAENNIPEMGLLKRKKKSCGFSPPEKDLWIEAKNFGGGVKQLGTQDLLSRDMHVLG